MKHIKTYEHESYTVDGQTFIIEGPVSKTQLQTYSFDEGLDAFRIPIEQFEAIQDISTLDEGAFISFEKKITSSVT